MRHLRQEAESMEREGIDPQLVEQADLRRNGLHGRFFGALTRPEGFALNPRKYLFGLADAATRHGARLFQNSAVTALDRRDRGFVLRTAQGEIRANQVIIATNGYSSEDLPPWLAGRYMPAQSTVMVTRPMSEAELEAQGWTTAQMAYDTRNMLHYFRLMPDRRFLFGMRGGLLASPGVEQRIRLKLRRDFDAMFPDWAQVETTHMWSGMVCLSRNLVPFVGPVPEQPGLFAGLCYHGNGVAMGTYSGRLLAGLILGQPGELPYSPVMQKMRKFPLGPMRRALMPPAYAVLAALDL
jgi:glycine/D-amino acid oxidase-like deaminating enzyme